MTSAWGGANSPALSNTRPVFSGQAHIMGGGYLVAWRETQGWKSGSDYKVAWFQRAREHVVPFKDNPFLLKFLLCISLLPISTTCQFHSLGTFIGSGNMEYTMQQKSPRPLILSLSAHMDRCFQSYLKLTKYRHNTHSRLFIKIWSFAGNSHCLNID